jgi:ribosomal protein L12E/L44/L45/RPP1/RPP2
MTKAQVFELLNLLRAVYPNFTVDQEKIDTWTKLLKDQDAEKVMANALQYAKENRFAPTVADLRAPGSDHKPDTRNMEIAFQQWVAEGNEPESFDWSTGRGREH